MAGPGIHPVAAFIAAQAPHAPGAPKPPASPKIAGSDAPAHDDAKEYSPEEAAQMAVGAKSGADVIAKIKECGYELVKISEEDAEGEGDEGGSPVMGIVGMRNAAAKKAMGGM